MSERRTVRPSNTLAGRTGRTHPMELDKVTGRSGHLGCGQHPHFGHASFRRGRSEVFLPYVAYALTLRGLCFR